MEKRRVLRNIDWLTKDAKSGDVLTFFFEGHGTDYDEKGKKRTSLVLGNDVLYSDELTKRLTQNVPRGVTIIVLLSCCHSGTTIDLQYQLDTQKGRWKPRKTICKVGDTKSGPAIVVLTACSGDEISVGTKEAGGFSHVFLSELKKQTVPSKSGAVKNAGNVLTFIQGLKAQARRRYFKAAALRGDDDKLNPFLPSGWKSALTEQCRRFYWKADAWKKDGNPPPPGTRINCPELRKRGGGYLCNSRCSVCGGTRSIISRIATWTRPLSDLTPGRRVRYRTFFRDSKRAFVNRDATIVQWKVCPKGARCVLPHCTKGSHKKQEPGTRNLKW